MRYLRRILVRKDVGPILRRYFINTLFDSTFVLLGIIVGVAYAPDPHIRVVMVAMVTSSLALGISTGVSVYEAESLERERRITELERALITRLENTEIERSSRLITALITLINFATPLFSCSVTIMPFVLVLFKALKIEAASWLSASLALTILFVAGVYVGRVGKKNPLMKGLRMAGFGLLAFLCAFFLNSLL